MNQALLSRHRDRERHRLPRISLWVGLLTIALTNPALAEERQFRTLSVTGQGIEIIPTTATQIQLGVEVQGETAVNVQQEVARRSAAVVELLRSRQVEKLQTTGIQLNPVYRSQNNEPRLIGYSGVNTVSFQVPTEQAGRLLDEAVQAGATRVDSVRFTASEPAIAAAQQQALRQATQDAQQQADTVLSSLNLSRKDIVSIQINGATPPPPRPLQAEFQLNRTALAQTPIIGGEQQVQAFVTLEVSY